MEGPEIHTTHFRVGLLHGERLIAQPHVLRALGAIIEPQGGLTLVRAALGPLRSVGVARCREDENFNKTWGRTIATGRALKEITG